MIDPDLYLADTGGAFQPHVAPALPSSLKPFSAVDQLRYYRKLTSNIFPEELFSPTPAPKRERKVANCFPFLGQIDDEEEEANPPIIDSLSNPVPQNPNTIPIQQNPNTIPPIQQNPNPPHPSISSSRFLVRRVDPSLDALRFRLPSQTFLTTFLPPSLFSQPHLQRAAPEVFLLLNRHLRHLTSAHWRLFASVHGFCLSASKSAPSTISSVVMDAIHRLPKRTVLLPGGAERAVAAAAGAMALEAMSDAVGRGCVVVRLEGQREASVVACRHCMQRSFRRRTLLAVVSHLEVEHGCSVADWRGFAENVEFTGVTGDDEAAYVFAQEDFHAPPREVQVLGRESTIERATAASFFAVARLAGFDATAIQRARARFLRIHAKRAVSLIPLISNNTKIYNKQK